MGTETRGSAAARGQDPYSNVELRLPAGALGSGGDQVIITTRETSDLPTTGRFKPAGAAPTGVDVTAKSQEGLAITNLNADMTVILDKSAEFGVSKAISATDAQRRALVAWNPAINDYEVVPHTKQIDVATN